jgi:hypothetical protein
MSPFQWALPFPDLTYPSPLFPNRRLILLRHVLQANHPRERLLANAATKLLDPSF